MRLLSYVLCCGMIVGLAPLALAKDDAAPKQPASGPGTGHIEVTADKSLEWYEDTRLYVARGNAKAVRGDMTIEADLLSAHEREQPPKPGSAKAANAPETSPAAPENASPTAPEKPAAKTANSGSGDIDKMTADGHVHVTTSKSNIYGDHAVYDLNQHVAFMKGKDNLKYATETDVVTASDSLEYWEDKKLAVARGHAVAVRNDRHVEGDVLTAEFRDTPNGKSELHTLTAAGNVTVITGNDVSRGDRAVYDINRNIAIITGHVRITRADGTQLTGDVGEVDFASNQSRLLNEGKGRVRALLTSKTKPKSDKDKKPVTSVSAETAAP